LRKYILLFLILASNLIFSEDFGLLIKAEGDIVLYRGNSEIEIKENMTLLEDDIIDAAGTVLIETSGSYRIIAGRAARVNESSKVEITDTQISGIKSGNLSLQDFLNELPEVPFQRSMNMNLFIILDVSTSMEEVFPEVIRYIDETIIGKIIIDNDYLFLSIFGDTADTKINRKVIFPEDYSKINTLLYSLIPDEEYTDIGLAMEILDNAISAELPYQKSFIFFITDGVNNPSENSKYYNYDVYKEGAFNAYTQIRSEDFKVMLLSIGEETAARDLSEPLSGEYLEVTREMDAEQINDLITDFVGSIEMVVPENIGKLSAETINLKVSFLSTYKDRRSVKLNKVNCVLDNEIPISIENFNSAVSIKGNGISIESYLITLPEDITSGSHKLKFDVESENNIVTRSVQEIRFEYEKNVKTPDSSLLLILLIIAVVANAGYFVFAYFNIKK
jgi:hypothetical protein